MTEIEAIIFNIYISIFISFLFFSVGGSTLGAPEKSARHELRQTQSLITLLLRERNHAEGKHCKRQQGNKLNKK